MPPHLLVVSGLPAAGKTTLATALAEQLGWPLVSKDDYKMIVLDNFPAGPVAERSRQAGKISFDVMWQVARVILRAGGNVVLETHFDRVLGVPPILQLAHDHDAALSQIFCEAPLPELERRHAERVAAGTRLGIDLPDIHKTLPPTANHGPLELGNVPLLRLDTTKPATIERAVSWVQGLSKLAP